jgi:hypothetical protein
MFIRENECRAVNRFGYAESLPEPLRETRFARTQFAFEAKHIARARERAQPRAEPLRLRRAVANNVEGVFV